LIDSPRCIQGDRIGTPRFETGTLAVDQYVPNILLVDDTPANLQLLSGILREQGYKLRPAPSGKLALRAARALPPDLILLDVRMPDMDGYEVCEQLKADPALKEIPVIFLSALSEATDKVRAFAVGGVDYITKPFQLDEVIARVETHLEIRRQKRQVQASYESLRRLECLRDSLIHMVVHDLRSPLMMLGGFLALLEKSESQNLSSNGSRFVVQARRAVDDLVGMVNSMLDVSRMEAGELKLNRSRCQLELLLREVAGGFNPQGDSAGIALEVPEQPVEVSADAALLSRVIQNLLGNAVRFASGRDSVRVIVSISGGQARVEIKDNGPGIPPEYHQKIFEKFGQVEDNRAAIGTGLGLAFCKFAVELHGGCIGVESVVGEGSTFWFTLPLMET
jgi:two-component system, sensor histidine kinase and response regulator